MAKKEKAKVQRVQLSNVEDPDWDDLYNKLWEQREVRQNYGRHYRYRKARFCQPEKVRLSQDGWDQIKRIIVERGICVEVINCCMGFTCGLVLYKDRIEPFPGASDGPFHLFSICSHMLPGEERSGFKEGWAEFEPLFTSEENIKRLKWNKLEMPKEAYHYDY